MFGYAVKHHAKRASVEVQNNATLTPLTLSSKLGRNEIFKEIIELQSMVSDWFLFLDKKNQYLCELRFSICHSDLKNHYRIIYITASEIITRFQFIFGNLTT